jgi:uroporphyrinogen decarboxylase
VIHRPTTTSTTNIFLFSLSKHEIKSQEFGLNQSASTSTEKRLLRALRGETLCPPPVWLMRQAGRYLPEYRSLRKKAKNFLDFCYSPELSVEATLQPLRRFELDAAILFSDILVVPHALGCRVEFLEGEGPALEPVGEASGIAHLNIAPLKKHLEPVYEAIDRLRGELGQETVLIGFAGAPWTLAAYMAEGKGSRDFRQAREWAYRDPDGFQALIDLLVEAIAEHLCAQIAAGVEVIQLFDSWAGILSPSQFERWSLKPALRVLQIVKEKHPSVPAILFPRGCGYLYENIAKEPLIEGLSLDTTVPLEWAATKLQGHSTVQGNLDPIALVVGGKYLEEEARSILDALSKGPHIFNLGHGVLPETPIEHVEQLLRIIHDYRR